MLYQAYQAHCDFMVPVRTLATFAATVIGTPNGMSYGTTLGNLTAAYELIARAGLITPGRLSISAP